jgi:phosphoribosylaminoimidazole-succinocarboxamide synthase
MLPLGRKSIAELMKKALITGITITDRDGSYLVDYAAQRGTIVADTKFEVGTADNELLLIDECLTSDSSPSLGAVATMQSRRSSSRRSAAV